ncbi:MAG: oxygen-dependent coproporphyrinogen oxidase [Alphaproteobacteria bacterium]|nr:oxygen-dependent coproporphyrinogen oxidase [Alphaproteobacteria bacterium]MDE2340518.1 oxygen-dependent coproporphyrinogen oxidase [Alphaproteobacteria bacterium]
MTPLNPQQQAARVWFEALRDRICAAFEAIEREMGSDATFTYTSWNREDDPTGESGGGVRGVMKGSVFEKVGVNVSTVAGKFSPEFAKTMHGTAQSGTFFATGISLVAHMANPHVPAVHMNTRYLRTGASWFGGGADLNPAIIYDDDTADFHAAMRSACDAHPCADYAHYKKWADDYFYIPHRKVHRGVGGIFYDHLEGDFDGTFAFTQSVGEAFLDIFPKLVRRRMHTPFSEAEKHAQRIWRGRYAEFNLVYDRGTTFGLKTGGNVDAILMSLPPEVVWE